MIYLGQELMLTISHNLDCHHLSPASGMVEHLFKNEHKRPCRQLPKMDNRGEYSGWKNGSIEQ